MLWERKTTSTSWNIYTDGHILSQREVFLIPEVDSLASPLPSNQSVNELVGDEHRWLQHVSDLLNKETLGIQDFMSWDVCEASQCTDDPSPTATSYIQPVFAETSNSPTIMYHFMQVIIKVSDHLNPGKSPVAVSDQPRYTLLKKCDGNFQTQSEKIHY